MTPVFQAPVLLMDYLYQIAELLADNEEPKSVTVSPKVYQSMRFHGLLGMSDPDENYQKSYAERWTLEGLPVIVMRSDKEYVLTVEKQPLGT
jgi:hypothetical protein